MVICRIIDRRNRSLRLSGIAVRMAGRIGFWLLRGAGLMKPARYALSKGMVTAKRVPWPGWESMNRVPSAAHTRSCMPISPK